jgi:hypothetical protein
MRVEYRLDWDGIARILEARPGNDEAIMLPWLEAEETPQIAHPALRRFGFDRHDAATNVRGLISSSTIHDGYRGLTLNRSSNSSFIGNVVYDLVGVAGNQPLAAAYAMVPVTIMLVFLLVARRLGAFEAI